MLNKVLDMGFTRSIIKKFGLSIRRLTVFPDGLGKTRIIAISDWITQNTLMPLHNVIFQCLKQLGTDYTYDQKRSIEQAKA